jgi:hypothetical protein
MPNNKEGSMLRYRETNTHVVQGTYPYEDVAAAASVTVSASASHSAPSQPSCNNFVVADAGFQAATYITTNVFTITITTAGVAIAVESAVVDSDLAHGATSAVDSVFVHGATSDHQPNAPSNASPLDWGGKLPLMLESN